MISPAVTDRSWCFVLLTHQSGLLDLMSKDREFGRTGEFLICSLTLEQMHLS